MSEPLIRLDRDDRLAELVLCSPPANSLSLEFLAQLERAVAAIPSDARALLIRSEVPRVFMAGGDIGYLLESPPDELDLYVERLQTAFNGLERYPYPVVAAIEGHCLGGGLELALCCDLRIVSESASLGLPEVTLGIFPAAGGTQRLVRAIGEARARDILVTGRRIDGREACALGLASRLVPEGRAVEDAREVAHELAFGASEALAAVKRLALSALDTTLNDGLAMERSEWRTVRATPNASEGLRAFLERRPPVYS